MSRRPPRSSTQLGSRIEIYQLDGAEFLKAVVPQLPVKSLTYLDPPYYVKGKELLYANYYNEKDHEALTKRVTRLPRRWVVSYDDAKEIRKLYRDHRSVRYGIGYSAHSRYVGREVMFFSDQLRVPAIADPTSVSSTDIATFEKVVARNGGR